MPTVAAASDLKFALEEVAGRFEKDTGSKLKLVFGSSGNFTSQILQGAPFHLFLSADENFVYKLADAGKTVDRGRAYAVGRIGIIVPPGSPLKADGEFKDLAAALKDGRLQKFAIANPEHAPYGARAKEALQHAGLWDVMKGKLVFGENISQTAQFALRGRRRAASSPCPWRCRRPWASCGTFALIPESWHEPLRQRMVLIKDAPPAARAFYEYLSTPRAQEVMGRYGFAMPNE